jgi:hypothetical protein
MAANRIIFLAIAAGLAYMVWVGSIVTYATHMAPI